MVLGAEIGGFIERADNTARILDVKYYLLLPSNQPVGGDIAMALQEAIDYASAGHQADW